jgi:8-oxo-dGTP pyrophosphatase MutT (NUDIX family)
LPDCVGGHVACRKDRDRKRLPISANQAIAAGEGDRYNFGVKGSKRVRDNDDWKTLASESHFANPHVDVRTEQVQTPTRPQPFTWTVVHRKAAVIIAPMTRDGKIVLIRQERVPIRTAIWEMPAGQIDGTGKPKQKEIEAVALRELREETGYELAKDGEVTALGHYFSSPGFTDEKGYFFLARPVESSSNSSRDETESIVDCRPFSVEELRRMIAENEIRDANTLTMCAQLAAHGFLSLDSRD